MPAKSKKQQQMMAIAEHSPADINPKNQDVLKMTHSQLHDFATTSTKGLPIKVKKETKKTTIIKPNDKEVNPAKEKKGKAPVRKDSGPVASADQRKQMAALCIK